MLARSMTLFVINNFFCTLQNKVVKHSKGNKITCYCTSRVYHYFEGNPFLIFAI